MRPCSLIIVFGALVGCSSKDAASDIAYANEWKFSVEGPVSGYVLIVNTGEDTLSLDTLQVKAITDDHPAASVKINTSPFATSIPAGQAGGFVTPLANAVLVDSGLVKEKRTDTNSDYFTIEIANAPEGTYDINATVELSLENIATKLPMIIHVVPGPVVYADPIAGKRVKLYR